MKTAFLVAALLLASVDSLDRDLKNARQHIAKGDFERAVTILEDALPKVDALSDDVQAQARTAMHFYAAVAYSGLEREDEASFHLEEAFRISPQMRSIDASKFDRRFVRLFERMRGETVSSERFDVLYPGFNEMQTPERGDPSTWGDSRALEMLGSKAEKREWESTVSPEGRERFIAEFWRVRDSSPATGENEYRAAFERRVAFADATFGSPGKPGALTDRGRVFTLLGEPIMVRRRALDQRDAMTVMNFGSRNIEVGTIEYWFYTREQLPESFAKPTMTFRFVSHQGIGTFVLQKDGLVMNALAMASKAPQSE